MGRFGPQPLHLLDLRDIEFLVALQRQRQRLLLLRIPGRLSTPSARPKPQGWPPTSTGGSTSSRPPVPDCRLVLDHPPERPVIQGAHDGLVADGAGNVGMYASPGSGWPQIAGNWPVDYPYWMATWTTSGPNSCGTVAGWQQKTAGLPTGGVPMVQWTDNVSNVSTGAVDGDYAC